MPNQGVDLNINIVVLALEPQLHTIEILNHHVNSRYMEVSLVRDKIVGNNIKQYPPSNVVDHVCSIIKRM